MYHQFLPLQSDKLISAIKNKQIQEPNEINERGESLLEVAAREGLWETVVSLLCIEAPIGRSLSYARERQHYFVIHILLACGAQHEQMSCQPIFLRSLFFYAIVHCNAAQGKKLFELIKPQLIKAHKQFVEENQAAESFLAKDLFHFLKLASIYNTGLIASILDLGESLKLQLNKSENQPLVSQPSQQDLCTKAFAEQNMPLLHLVLQNDKQQQLFIKVLQSNQPDLAIFILFAQKLNPLHMAFALLKEHCLDKLFNLQNGLDGLVAQVITAQILKPQITPKMYELFKYLAVAEPTKTNYILRVLQDNYPHNYLQQLSALRELPMQERMNQVNLSVAQYSFLVEKFMNCYSNISMPQVLQQSGDRKLNNTEWQQVISFLDTDATIELNRTSRYLHRLVQDPQTLALTRSSWAQRHLAVLTQQLEKLENEYNSRSRFAERDCWTYAVFMIFLIPMVIEFTNMGLFIAANSQKKTFDSLQENTLVASQNTTVTCESISNQAPECPSESFLAKSSGSFSGLMIAFSLLFLMGIFGLYKEIKRLKQKQLAATPWTYSENFQDTLDAINRTYPNLLVANNRELFEYRADFILWELKVLQESLKKQIEELKNAVERPIASPLSQLGFIYRKTCNAALDKAPEGTRQEFENAGLIQYLAPEV